MVDDMFQPQGVLVRLQEDNTMGHVARIIASQHRQRQEEWPSLLQGTGVCVYMPVYLCRLLALTMILGPFCTCLSMLHTPWY